jgi:hypothetical protein
MYTHMKCIFGDMCDLFVLCFAVVMVISVVVLFFFVGGCARVEESKV